MRSVKQENSSQNMKTEPRPSQFVNEWYFTIDSNTGLPSIIYTRQIFGAKKDFFEPSNYFLLFIVYYLQVSYYTMVDKSLSGKKEKMKNVRVPAVFIQRSIF